jgi:hypothetical protein
VNRLSRRSSAALLSLLATVAAAGCGSDSSTGPHTTGLSIAAGGAQSDTVLSTLRQALIMQLSAAGGAGGHVIQFTAVQVPTNPYEYYAYVHRLDSDQPTTFAVDTTTLVGRAEIQVVLGQVAGPAPLIVAVPDLGIVDTVTFTATPGNPVTISVLPKDTSIVVNASETLRGGATDAYGNVRSDPVTYSVLSGPASVSGATVTGTAVGRVSILVSASSKVDTAYVSVVPSGTLAAGWSGTIRTFNLDGSGMQTVSGATNVGAVRWAPSGTSLVYDQTSAGLYDGSSSIFTVTLAGTVAAVDVSPGYYDQWPQWSRDGSTIYYSKISNGSAIWHVTPTGTSDDSVANQNPSFDIFPSPSPDGTELAYIADFSSTSDLRILTLATGAVTDLNVEAWAPVWSPTGQQIAYLNQTNYSAPIAIVNADGTGQRVLTTQAYQQNFDWSPDGQYIVAQNTAGGEFDLINVATGETLPLKFTTSSYYSPAWQPTTGASPQRVPAAVPRAKTIFGRRVR